MDRWMLTLGTNDWVFVDADGTGRLFLGNKVEDINERTHSKLFAKVRRLGKKCVGPGEMVEVVKRPRRALAL